MEFRDSGIAFFFVCLFLNWRLEAQGCNVTKDQLLKCTTTICVRSGVRRPCGSRGGDGMIDGTSDVRVDYVLPLKTMLI